MKTIEVSETGGPEKMVVVDRALTDPVAGEVQIHHTAIGLNFIDIYFRTGLYPAPHMPFTPGNEAAGVIDKIGPDVSGFAIGDRVAYAGPIGAYCEARNITASVLVKIPDGISDETAAAMMLKGMTARYLLRKTFKVEVGQTILFHAAAGGVGLIAGQWAKHLGATVIGTAGSAEKVALALAHGYDHVINYREQNFVEEVANLTEGKGVDVVYDSVGNDTYPGSLDCLKPLGTWVSFGQSSGPLPEINLAILAQKGSLFATRPTLFTYIAERQELENTANDLFDVVGSGVVKVEINQRYALENVGQAHDDLEGRRTSGASILILSK